MNKNIISGCEGKIKHTTRSQATEQMRRMKRKGAIGALNVYYCRVCGNYHIGNWERDLVKSAIKSTGKKHREETIRKLKEVRR